MSYTSNEVADFIVRLARARPGSRGWHRCLYRMTDSGADQAVITALRSLIVAVEDDVAGAAEQHPSTKGTTA